MYVVRQLVDMLGEAGQDAGHVLEPIPPAYLHHDAGVPRHGAAIEDESGMAANDTSRPVPASEGKAATAVDKVDYLSLPERRSDVRVDHVSVLCAERVERRRNHPHLVVGHPLGNILDAREDHGSGGPATLGENAPPAPVAGPPRAAPDMAAPPGFPPGVPQAGDHPSR